MKHTISILDSEAQIGGIGPWIEYPETEQAPAPFDADAAIWMGQCCDGVYVQLATRSDASGYVLHMVWDNMGGCGDFLSSSYPSDATFAFLMDQVEGACCEAADIVAGWGLRRPGTSRLKKVVRSHVQDAMREMEDIRMGMDATTEQSREYFDRYIAGDR